jgi:hypothetical protein
MIIIKLPDSYRMLAADGEPGMVGPNDRGNQMSFDQNCRADDGAGRSGCHEKPTPNRGAEFHCHSAVGCVIREQNSAAGCTGRIYSSA